MGRIFIRRVSQDTTNCPISIFQSGNMVPAVIWQWLKNFSTINFFKKIISLQIKFALEKYLLFFY